MRFLATSALAAALLAASAPHLTSASDRLEAEDYLNLLRIDLRAVKGKLVVEALELTVEEAKVFLPIYQDYDETLSRLNSDRISQLRNFTSNYAGIDDAKARELTARTFEFMRRRLDLLEKFTRKVERSVSPRTAARFAQIEYQLLMLVDVQLASDLPLVPRRPLPEQGS